MLVMFRAKNFLSFKDEVILDLRKSGLREHQDHTFSAMDLDLLKTTAIYGANASGKSNLICALSAFADTVKSQFYTEKEDVSFEDSPAATIASFKPFMLSKERNNIIEFEIIFIHKEKLFQYGFNVDKSSKMSFIKEWLLVNNEEVFNRNSTVKYGRKYKDVYHGLEKVRTDRLLISTIDYFAVNDDQLEIISVIKDYFMNRLNIHFEIYFEASVKGLSWASFQHENIMKDENLLRKITTFVKKIDVGIANFEVHEIEKINKKTKESKKEKVLKSIHNVYNDQGEIINTQAFNLEDESSGTKRFISFINNIIKMMDNGGVYIIDELSSSFHPILTKFIIDLFQSKSNKKNAQLIFTTHETTIMNRHQFRRDEIVIVDKNVKGESFTYSLSDINVRKDATYDSDYFKGKYGGIPIIDDVLSGDTFND